MASRAESSSHYWSADEEAELRRLFDAGISYERIAEAFGLSRNSITAKLHRMGLHRQNPVKPRAAGEPPPTVQRVGKVSLPPLPSLAKGNEPD